MERAQTPVMDRVRRTFLGPNVTPFAQEMPQHSTQDAPEQRRAMHVMAMEIVTTMANVNVIQASLLEEMDCVAQQLARKTVESMVNVEMLEVLSNVCVTITFMGPSVT